MKNFRVSFSKNYDKIILECDEKIINSNMNTEKFCKWLMTSELKFEFIGEDKDFEYYKSIDLTSEIMDNPKIILTEDEFIDYAEGTKLLYFSFIDSAQFVFRNIAEKIYFKTLFDSSTEED